MSRCCKLAGPARLLRQEPHPARRRHATSARARSSACSAATARAARRRSRRSWAWSTARARSRCATRRSSATSAFDIAHRGIGYVPENRDIFPKLTVHQNLLLGEKRGKKKPRWSLRRHVPDVPAPEGARAHRGRRAVGRRAADADAVPHADGRPRPDHDRRADRRPGAEDRRAGRRVPEGAEAPRRLGPAGRAEADDRAADLRALLRDGPRQHRLRRHAGRRCAPTPTSARSGWRSERASASSSAKAPLSSGRDSAAGEPSTPRIERTFFFVRRSPVRQAFTRIMP